MVGRGGDGPAVKLCGKQLQYWAQTHLFCYQQLKVMTVSCLFSSVPLLYLYESLLAMVVAKGCYSLIVQVPDPFRTQVNKITIIAARIDINVARICCVLPGSSLRV
jgi:hypothetical protein